MLVDVRTSKGGGCLHAHQCFGKEGGRRIGNTSVFFLLTLCTHTTDDVVAIQRLVWFVDNDAAADYAAISASL